MVTLGSLDRSVGPLWYAAANIWHNISTCIRCSWRMCMPWTMVDWLGLYSYLLIYITCSKMLFTCSRSYINRLEGRVTLTVTPLCESALFSNAVSKSKNAHASDLLWFTMDCCIALVWAKIAWLFGRFVVGWFV